LITSLRRITLSAAAVALATALTAVPAHAAAATGSITGHLTTATGAPAANAFINVYAADDWDGAGSAQTDEHGDFTVSQLKVGDYQLEINPQDGPAQYYSHHTSLSDGERVTVRPGASTAIDESLMPSGTMRGQVLDAAGNPAPNVRLDGKGEELGGSVYATTDEDGRWESAAFVDSYTLAFTLDGNYDATQYAPSTLDEDKAASYSVTTDQVTEVNVDLLPTGSLSGRFTTFNGEPLRDAYVTVEGVGTGAHASQNTNADGEFAIAPVFAGKYKARFSDGNGAEQWAYGKTKEAEADVIVVEPGKDSVVDDALLAPGSIRVTATDATTGRALTDFCASRGESRACTTTGEALLKDVPRGSQEINVFSADGYLHDEWVTVDVGAGTTDVAVALHAAGAITALVVDRSTGKPVADVCFAATPVGSPILPDGYGDCSASDGKVRLGRLDGGAYNLFARPSEESGLGAQWVGWSGGTGDPNLARIVPVRTGTAASVPTIRLDRAGSITGLMTSAATGAPIKYGYVSTSAYNSGAGPSGGTEVDENGHYTLDGLGPYPWALHLTAEGHAPQWSGAKANRLSATKAKVTAGRTVTFNPVMAVGTELTGVVRDRKGRPLQDSYVFAYNAVTREDAGSSWDSDGTFRMLVMGPQLIKLEYDISHGDNPSINGWLGGADFAHATPILVSPRGSRTVDITVPIG
jgi:5-hydroxyisourate hydrolase-like protein (transthyretin family)